MDGSAKLLLAGGGRLVVEESQLRAELRVAAFAVQHDLSQAAVQHLSELVNGLADSPDTIGRMKLGHNKCASLVRRVLTRSVHHDLDEVLQQQPFSLIVEEPETGAGGGAMAGDRRIFCVIAKYFSEAKNRVRSELLEAFTVDVSETDGSDGNVACNAVTELLARRHIPTKNLVGVAADLDGPLLADQEVLATKLLGGRNAVVFHAVHRSMTTVALKALLLLPTSLMELMHHFGSLVLGQSVHLHGGQRGSWVCVPEARKRFAAVHPSQWLASPACVGHLLERLDDLVLLLQAGVERNGSSMGQALLAAALDPYAKAYLHFLSCVLSHFFNIEQAFSAELVLLPHFLCECQSRFRSLCQHFMAPSAFMIDDRDLAKVDPFDARNVLPLKDIYVGVECREHLGLLGDMAAAENDIFLRGCLRFLQTAADEVRRRVPLGGELLEHLSFLDPEVALRAEGRSSLPSLSALITSLPGVAAADPRKLDEQWMALPHYFSASDAEELRKLPVDSMWGIIANMSTGGPEQGLVFGELGRMAKLALTLPVPDRETAAVVRATEHLLEQRGEGSSCSEEGLENALGVLLPLRLSVLQEAGDCDKLRPTVKHRKFYSLEIGRRTDFEEDGELFKSGED